MILSNGKTHSLVFGGQLDGDITLIHSTQSILTMLAPCPAHDSRMSMLIGATDPVVNTVVDAGGTMQTQAALISYGKISDRLHVWAVVVDEDKLTLGLHLLMIVKMVHPPFLVSLMASTVCLAVEEGKVIMFRVEEEKKVSASVQVS